MDGGIILLQIWSPEGDSQSNFFFFGGGISLLQPCDLPTYKANLCRMFLQTVSRKFNALLTYLTFSGQQIKSFFLQNSFHFTYCKLVFLKQSFVFQEIRFPVIKWKNNRLTSTFTTLDCRIERFMFNAQTLNSKSAFL